MIKNTYIVLGLVLTLGLILATLSNNIGPAIAQTNVTGATANPSIISKSPDATGTTKTNNETFSASGAISSLIFVAQNPDDTVRNGNNASGLTKATKFVLSGDWILTVNGGNVGAFTAKFIKVLNDREKWHTHIITNFKSNNNKKVQLTANKSASISGTVDVKLNGTSIWNGTKVNILLDRGKTITITLDNQATGNHFQGQPIYGVVESIRDANGNEMLKTLQQAVQRTEK